MTKLTTFIFFSLILLILSCGMSVVGQDVSRDVLKWDIVLDIDLAADSTASAYNSYFITYGQDKIEWITKRTDKTGQVSTTSNKLTITSTSGSWKNIKEDGSIQFGVSMNKSEGVFTAKRASGVYAITVNLTGKTGGRLMKEFKISGVAKP
jgi:hypothetical protein